MGDYFEDEDAMIHEYTDAMDQLEEPPPPQELFDEAMMAQAERDMATAAEATGANVPQQPMEIDPDPHTTRLDPTPLNSPQAPFPKSQQDMFSFERFDGKREWRTTIRSPTAAREWKKPFTGDNDEKDRATLWEQAKARLRGHSAETTAVARTNAPEAQLLEYWNRARQDKNVHVLREHITEGVRLHPLPGRASTAMTLGDGTRVHVVHQPEIITSLNTPSPRPSSTSASSNILGVPMAKLLRRSDAIMRKVDRQKQMRKRVRFGGVECNDDKETVDEDGQSKSENYRYAAPNNGDNNKHQLWVDKHAPCSFSHLLSDDRTNREALRALRAWDPYVFRRDIPKRPVILQRGAAEQGSTTTEVSSMPKVSDMRPDESSRVLLLSGPAGVGKTTLAHILARHAGYRPLEVNASDERSASVLKEHLLRAMESATLNLNTKSGDDLMGRPNCLILDEIDGADAKGAIAGLVEVIRAEIAAPQSKRPAPYLRRPIIFICNHKYAPALRPLLPFAKQFDVAAPSATRLVARLRAVLNEERMSVFGGSSLLYQLVAGTGGDIRSCLYTLQFASAHARELDAKKRWSQGAELRKAKTVVDISSALRGSLSGSSMKDERNDVAGAITAVFRKTKDRQSNLECRPATSGSARVLQLVENFGDNSKTIDCVFTNLLHVSYVDPSLDRCTLAHEWLSGADIFRSNKVSAASNNHMEYFSMQRHHMPSTAAAIHLLCRVETRTNLTFSTRRLADARYQHESNSSLAQKFVDGLSAKARASACTGTVSTDTIPYSLWMLSAGQGSCSLRRAVSSLEVMSNHERIAFDSHISLLRALGLTYVPRDDAAQRAYNESKGKNVNVMRLEPQIDRLVQFQDLSLPPNQTRKSIPSALKELLAHRATLEGMKDRDAQAPLDGQQSSDCSMFGASKDAESTLTTGGQSISEENASVTPSPKRQTAEAPNICAPPSKKSKVTFQLHRPKNFKSLSMAHSAFEPTQQTSSGATNFLGIGALRAKAARNARKAALVGFDKSTKATVSNTGSGIAMSRVCRFKYQKGFTQAVRTPCRIQDFL